MRGAATVDLIVAGDAAILSVSGLVDERFLGFGDIDALKTVVLNVSGMTRMTSFGVRQWLKAMDALPKSITDLYLLGCPTFFVDQLNMVLNFGGTSKTLTTVAPYTCPSCGVESGELIDVLVERANLAKGGLPEKECTRCGGKLEFDETPESYFGFVSKYAATSIQPAAAQLLAEHGLYTSSDIPVEKPPRIIKLVHGSVTYFRIIGTIGSMFRARPLLVGAEGEVVIDLAEVDRFDSAGQREWRRLLKSLASQVPAVTLVDVNESFLATTGDTLMLARNIAVVSVLVPYRCVECGRTSQESVWASWPLQFDTHICTTCGGVTHSALSGETLLPLRKASTIAPPASAKVIGQRDEILSRALIDASVAQAGENATPAVSTDDTILGKYKIVRRLSVGGMAEVFLAKQVGIGGFEKLVALKRIQRELLETRHQAIELFLNEAKIAGRLTHPNIVQVLDVGEVAGALYLAMEYVHGKDLRDVIRKLQQTRTMLPFGEACYIMREVAQALHHAYWSADMTGQQLAVVHRDVSPHNIILSYDGMVKLLDFGVAISAVTERAETMIVGKWLYMSPETTTNQQIDHRSDLFSLGVILYLLCSGQMPFTGKDPKEIVKKIRAGQYKPLQEIVPIPERLAVLVGRLLSPNPDDRPQRGQEVAIELNEIARQYGIESSGSRIASILKQLFPEEVGGVSEQPVSAIREIVMESRSPGSLSLSGGTGTDSSVPRDRVRSDSIPAVPRDRVRSDSIPAVHASAPVSRPFSATLPGTNGPGAMAPQRAATSSVPPPINSAPISRQFMVPGTDTSGLMPRQITSSPITRRKSTSSQLLRQGVPPHVVAVPSRPTALNSRPALNSRSIVRALITVAVGILFAIGVLLLFRSD
jgi:serine/threonine protein kinase